MHHLQIRLPVGRDSIHEGEEIRDADIIDSGGIKVGGKGHAGQSGVASVASAIDAHTLGIGNAFPDEPVDTISDIILHVLTPLLEALFPKSPAVTSGAAIVHLENGETAVGQEL